MQKAILSIILTGCLLSNISAQSVEYKRDSYGSCSDQEYKVLLIVEKINQGNDPPEIAALKAMFFVELDLLINRTKTGIIQDCQDEIKHHEDQLPAERCNERKEKIVEIINYYKKWLAEEEEKLVIRKAWQTNRPFDK
jgi:hypothetical protein